MARHPYVCAAVCLFATLLPLHAQDLSTADRAAADSATKDIRPAAIRAHMRFLSDSLLQGRAPDTPGYEIAAHYVATQLESLGLQPGGTNGTWYQPVPLRKALLDTSQSSLVFLRNGKEQKLVDGQDYVLSASVLTPNLNVEAPVVFVGFGVTAPEDKYDDYAGIDVHGKIVAMLGGAPSRFSSTVRAYYSDDIVKRKNAHARGAIGIITFQSPEDQKRAPWEWSVPQFRMGNINWLDKDGVPHDALPYSGDAALNQSGGEILFTGASKTLDQVFATSRASQPQAFPLAWTARIHSVSTEKNFASPNIVAKLTGSDPAVRDEYIVYTAHVDHLGICPPINRDNVCHGALDNASGTASLLEIARAYASLPRAPRRSVLFVFVTGEEAGLLGSDYFANFPTVPAPKILANFNIDGAPGAFYPIKEVVAMGAEHSTLGKNAAWAARRMGYEIVPDPMPEEGFFIRSDQYSFVLRGVPALYFSEGPQSSDPNINGLEIVKKWAVTRYHTPLDSMDQPINYESTAKGSALNFLVGYSAAQQAEIPTWNKGDLFGTKFGSLHPISSPAAK